VKQWWIRCLIGLGALLLSVWFLMPSLTLNFEPGFTIDNLRRIRPGMTLRQVESLLGQLGTPPMCGQFKGALGYDWAANGMSAHLFFEGADFKESLKSGQITWGNSSSQLFAKQR
jgi:hypothetical protein